VHAVINKLNNDAIDQATALCEMIYVREGLYKFSNSDFNMADAESLIRLLARQLDGLLNL
jgi:hypothetical protein